jgi:hypothetical protein
VTDHIDQLLATAESTLAALQTATEHVTAVALQFGYEIGEVGRVLTQHPEVASKVRAFVERTAPVVGRDLRLGRWFGSVYDAAESRSSDTEDYVHALALRSALEFFIDLYRDSAAHDRVAGLDIGDTDDQLKEWGAQQYLEEIPPGFPASHVWWHQSLSGK